MEGVLSSLSSRPQRSGGEGPAVSPHQQLIANGRCTLPFVIPTVPGFPTSPLSPATTYVVLFKENHMQLTEAATLHRKSGGAEGSAVPRTFLGNVFQLLRRATIG